MGQRQSTGGSGGTEVTASVPAGSARYRPYASTLTVDGASSSAAAGSGPSGRNGGIPSSASATPDHHHHHHHHHSGYSSQRSAVTVGSVSGRLRALSLGNFPGTSSQPGSSRAVSIGGGPSDMGVISGVSSPDSDDDSTDDGGGLFGALTAVSSLPPAHLSFYQDIKCPVCHKSVPPDSIEVHLVMCLTKPHIVYNEDILTEDKGECAICLDDLQQGAVIARLPCLCIYHKSCIDAWFNVNRSCPEHPGD